jgi:hypothetical protein
VGGFGSGRHGGTVTAEGTASYVIIAISSLASFLRKAQCLMGTIHFDEGKFPIFTIDTSDPSNAYIELRHPTRDEREGERVVRDRVRLIWTVPSRLKLLSSAA